MEEGQSYTRQELMALLQVSKNQFEKHNKVVMNYLDTLCEYTIELDPNDRRKRIFTIQKMKRPFEPYKQKTKRKQELKEKVYTKCIKQVLHQDNVQTGSSITREAVKEPEVQEFNYSFNTIANDIRSELRNEYGTYFEASPNEKKRIGYVSDRRWCKLDKPHNKYIPLDAKELEDLKNIFKKIRENTLISELDDMGSITAEGRTKKSDSAMVCRLQTDFFRVISVFKKKYKMWPVMANVYTDGLEIPQEVLDRYKEYEEEQRLNNLINFEDDTPAGEFVL